MTAALIRLLEQGNLRQTSFHETPGTSASGKLRFFLTISCAAAAIEISGQRASVERFCLIVANNLASYRPGIVRRTWTKSGTVCAAASKSNGVALRALAGPDEESVISTIDHGECGVNS